MKNKWEIVHECDDEDGNPSVWCREINHEKYGRYCWICDKGGHFSVDVKRDDDLVTLVKCKSLKSAKRWVTINLL